MRGLAPTLTAVLALFGGTLCVREYLDWRTQQLRLAELAGEVVPEGLQQDLAAGLPRETSTARAATRLAFLLLQLELDRGWLGRLPEAAARQESRRGPERLRLARGLAREALAAQPSSWRAAAVIGASRYLEAARSGRSEQPAAAWRAPLETAMRLGPGQAEPPILLASFYLSRWSSLSAAERREVPPVLARAFDDARSLRRLLPAWVRLAPSLAELLEPIPDRPGAWRELGREFLRLGDLERFAVSHRRGLASLEADLAVRVERGRARLGGGDRKAGLGLLRSVFSAPPDLAYRDSVAAALAALGEDATAPESRDGVDAWHRWAEDLCVIGRCPLDPVAMTRLARAAGGTAGRGEPRLEPAPEDRWPAGSWLRRGAVYRLPLRSARPGSSLRLAIGGIPDGGAALELSWDGRFLGVATVYPGEPLIWPLASEPGAHLLQVRHLTGRPLPPGELTLGPPPPTL